MSEQSDPKEKANFYYRKSLTLKRRFEELEDTCMLLDKLPESYLEKIDLQRAAIFAMDLIEKVVTLLELTKSYPDEGGVRRAHRRVRVEVDNPLPEIEGISTSAYISITYEPSQEEIAVCDRLTKHVDELTPIVKPQLYVPIFPTYSVKEFKKKLKKWKTKKNFTTQGGTLNGSLVVSEPPE